MSVTSRLRRAFAPILRAINDIFSEALGLGDVRLRIAAFDALEARQMLSSDTLSLAAGYIQLDPADADVVQVYASATPTGTPEHTYVRSALTSLVINGTAGADSLTIDYSNGTPLKDDVLTFNGGAGTDSVILVGRSSIRATIEPSATATGDGSITGYHQDFAYSGVDLIAASNFSAVTLVTPNAADDVTLNRTSTGTAEISGTSGGSKFDLPGISIAADIPKIVLDLATHGASSSTDTVDFTGSADPANFSYTRVDFGNGANNFTTSATWCTVQLTGPGIVASVANAVRLDFVSHQTLDSLTVGANAAVEMAADTLRTLRLNSLTLPSTASLDLNASTLMVDPAGISTASLHDALATGRNIAPGGVADGTWDGQTGIVSSKASQAYVANGSTEFYSLGYGDTANMPYNDAPEMQNPVSAVFVKYTRTGDATMDGVVGATDVTVVGALYDPTYDPTGPGGPKHWYEGDFNYNGIVDDADMTVLGAMYDSSLVPSDVSVTGDTAGLTATLTLTSTGTAVDAWFVYWMDDTRTEYSGATGYADLSDVAANHTYETPGQYDAIVIARSGGLDQIAGTITIIVSAPEDVTVTATGPGTAIAEGAEYELTLGAPEGITMWTVEWGDGTTQNIAGPDATPTHTYGTAPTGPIYASATDDEYTYDADPVWADLLPIAPTTLSHTGSFTGQQLTLTWIDNSVIEDGFLIEQREGTDEFAAVAFAPASTATAPATVTFTLSGPFDPSKDYHFRVSALSGSTLSDPTATLNLTSLAVPNFPTDLTATANSQTQITLCWLDHNDEADSYIIERSDGGVAATPIQIDPENFEEDENGKLVYTDTGLDSGTRYTYHVYVVDPKDSTLVSGYAATELATLPEAPTGLAALAVSFRHIDLAWDDGNGNANGSDIVGYQIYRSTEMDFTPGEDNLIDTVSEPSYSDTTVTTGQPYYYFVMALTGDGVASNASSQATPEDPLPDVPSASGNSTIDEGALYTLTLLPNGNPVTGWSIFWGDGTTDSLTTHTFYDQAYSRDILIRYEDADGIYDLDPISVDINKVALTVDLTQSDTGADEGSLYTLTLVPTDPGQNTIVSWAIDWNVGTTGQPDIQTIFGNPSTVQHRYAAHGSYTISAMATDSRGDTSSETDPDATWEIQVADVAPTLTVTGPPDYTLHLSAADPGEDALVWTINWGDGTSSSVTAAFINGIAVTDAPPHTYANTGGPFDIDVSANGTDVTTINDVSAQKMLYHFFMGSSVYGDNLGDMSSSTLTIKSAYGHPGVHGNNIPDNFGGDSNTAYVLGSDPTNAIREALTGTVYDPANNTGCDWPDGYNISTTLNNGIYAFTITLHGEETDIQWTGYLTPIQVVMYPSTGPANEGSGATQWFYLGHNGGDTGDGEFTTYLRVSGEAPYGANDDYELQADSGISVVQTGEPGVLAVTFDVGVPGGHVWIVPIQDSTPEWTERIVLTLADPRVTAEAGSTNPLVMELVDDDPVNIEIDGVSEADAAYPGADIPIDYGWMDPAADDNLVRVELYYQSEDKPGAVNTLTLSDPVDFQVLRPDGTLLLGTPPGGTAISSVSLPPASGGLASLLTRAIGAGSAYLILAAADDAVRTENRSDSQNTVSLTAGTYLDVDTVLDNTANGILAQELKKTTGAFVPKNNDDDDYSIGRTPGTYGEDCEENEAVVGEDDLLPIIIHGSPNLAGRQFDLVWGTEKIRIYKNPDRTEPVLPNTPLVFLQQDMTWYVEGVDACSNLIRLRSLPAKKDLDSIRVTVFGWTGPLNVPQFGTYRYNVGDPDEKLAKAKWLAPSHGTLISRGKNLSDIDIQWDAGPLVGKAIYQADTQYVWDLGVNVVRVTVTDPDESDGPTFQDGEVVDQGMHDGNRRVEAVGPGLTWKAKVTFEGPLAEQRGVKQMRAGYVQNLKVVTLQRTYGNGRAQVSNLQGATYYWDTEDRRSYEDKFYSTKPNALFENADPAKGKFSETILGEDGPYIDLPPVLGRANLRVVGLDWSFRLFVAAATKDERNGAKHTYAAQAQTVWAFDASGTFNPKWTGNAKGIMPPTAWGAADGQTKMNISPIRFNDAIETAGWH